MAYENLKQEISPIMNMPTDDIAIAPDEFKGLNPDLWVEIAVRQCLNAAIIDAQKYVLAVQNLEGVLVTKLDSTYTEECINVQRQKMDEDGKNFDEAKFATFKFRKLMELIERKRPMEASLEL